VDASEEMAYARVTEATLEIHRGWREVAQQEHRLREVLRINDEPDAAVKRLDWQASPVAGRSVSESTGSRSVLGGDAAPLALHNATDTKDVGQSAAWEEGSLTSYQPSPSPSLASATAPEMQNGAWEVSSPVWKGLSAEEEAWADKRRRETFNGGDKRSIVESNGFVRKFLNAVKGRV
jgi:hypothetical protein